MNLFITATNTNIGKTYTTLYLIKKLSSMGLRVGVYKPIETGFDVSSPENSDAYKLLKEVKKYNKDFEDFHTNDILSYHFKLPSAPYVAKEKSIIKTSKLLQDYNTLSSKCDILLIEGAGGLMVPIEKDFFMIDLIVLFRAKALLVSSSALGCINDLLLSINALSLKNIEFDWVVNLYKDSDDFFKITYPYYKDTFKKTNILGQDDDILEFILK